MRAKIFLDTRETEKRKEGFPLVCRLNNKGKRTVFSLGVYFEKNEWNLKTDLPFDKSKSLYVQKFRLKLEGIVLEYLSGIPVTFDQIKDLMLGRVNRLSTSSLYEFWDLLIQEKVNLGKDANAKVYLTAKRQFEVFKPSVFLTDVDYNFLNAFKTWQQRKGNSKNTIHNYLRTCRAVYNEAVRKRMVENTLPFDGVFKGITVKSNRTKKRNISKDSIQKLESLTGLTYYLQRSVDLWLLLFYFGGQDLKDVYYLKNNQISGDRVYFIRGKLDGNGYEFDLPICEKAQKIIDKYKVKGEYLFKWRKDFTGYNTFKSRFRNGLLKIQSLLDIPVLPMGGNLTIKVARHSFATIGKQLFIEADLLRELMGHERSDVDTIYKDKYPKEVRDTAYNKIVM